MGPLAAQGEADDEVGDDGDDAMTVDEPASGSGRLAGGGGRKGGGRVSPEFKERVMKVRCEVM